MAKLETNAASTAAAQQPPPLVRDARGAVAPGTLADVIEWFLDYDRRVNMIRHPKIEAIFQWKQTAGEDAGEAVYKFDNAEARLAVGIVQAVTSHADERALHAWLSQLLNALEEAARTNEEIAQAYQLDAGAESAVAEAAKIPTARGREVYLTCCWLEALCTAELRVLGWVYQELYGRAYQPANF